MKKPLTIIVASANPVKLEATRLGFAAMFEGEEFEIIGTKDAKSEVSESPASDAETRLGAQNRVEHAQKLFPKADYWVGIEGGRDEIEGQFQVYAWIVIANSIRKSQTRTVSFLSPEVVSQKVKEGQEFYSAAEQFFKRTNLKQQEGTIGVLSNNKITRTEQYVPAVITALFPFKWEELY